MDHPDQTNVDNGIDYPTVTQPQSGNEHLDPTLIKLEGKPTSTHITTNCQRMGTGEEIIECCAHAHQDIHTNFTSPSEKQTTTKLRDFAQPTCKVISRNTSDSTQLDNLTQAQNLGCHNFAYIDDSPTSHAPLEDDSGSNKTYDLASESDVSNVDSDDSEGTSTILMSPPGRQENRSPVSPRNTSCTDDTGTSSAQPENVKSSSNVPDRAYDYMTRSAGGLEHPSTVAEGISLHGGIRVRTQGTDAILIPDPTPDNSLQCEGVDSSTLSVRNEEPEEVLDPVTATALKRPEVPPFDGDTSGELCDHSALIHNTTTRASFTTSNFSVDDGHAAPPHSFAPYLGGEPGYPPPKE
ncbi:hypothetical protein AAF712_016571, partial [Marasmius tenuissimus]